MKVFMKLIGLTVLSALVSSPLWTSSSLSKKNNYATQIQSATDAQFGQLWHEDMDNLKTVYVDENSGTGWTWLDGTCLQKTNSQIIWQSPSVQQLEFLFAESSNTFSKTLIGLVIETRDHDVGEDVLKVFVYYPYAPLRAMLFSREPRSEGRKLCVSDLNSVGRAWGFASQLR